MVHRHYLAACRMSTTGAGVSMLCIVVAVAGLMTRHRATVATTRWLCMAKCSTRWCTSTNSVVSSVDHPCMHAVNGQRSTTCSVVHRQLLGLRQRHRQALVARHVARHVGGVQGCVGAGGRHPGAIPGPRQPEHRPRTQRHLLARPAAWAIHTSRHTLHKGIPWEEHSRAASCTPTTQC